MQKLSDKCCKLEADIEGNGQEVEQLQEENKKLKEDLAKWSGNSKNADNSNDQNADDSYRADHCEAGEFRAGGPWRQTNEREAPMGA